MTEDQKAEASKAKGAVRSEVVTVEESRDSNRGEEEEGGLGATWPPSAKTTRPGDCLPEAAAGGYQPATGATEEHATAAKEHARALGEQEEEAVPHASPEEIDSEAAGISESGADGGARVDANPGQHVPYEEEETSAEFSDAWWIASDRDVLAKFSLFEHELRSHVPFSSSCEVCVRERGLKKARHRTEVHQNEVQLDQFWHGSLRFLILVHSKSFAIGCVSGDGPREAIVAGMPQWLMHFSLANKDCLFTCDAEGYTRTLWQQLLQDFPSFQGTIEQFAAGRHAPVAERGVAVAKVERKPTQAPPSVYFRRNGTCCTPAKQSRSSHRSICVWFLPGASLGKSLTLGIHSGEAWCC